MSDQFDTQVLEIVLGAGLDGIKASVIVDQLNSTTGLVRHALLHLEAIKLIERTRKRGRNLHWGPLGVAAHHRSLLASSQEGYERRRAKEKREQRALQALDSDVDLLPVRRVIVPALSAPPLRKPCPASAWEVGAW